MQERQLPYGKRLPVPVRYLKSLDLEEVDYLRFPGNYGDSLIWHGTLTALSRIALSLNQITCEGTPRSSTLVVDGGGNLVDLYDDAGAFIRAHGNAYERVVVLPHTICGVESLRLLAALGRRLSVFCRERVSFHQVRASCGRAQVGLAHDTAFWLLPHCVPKVKPAHPRGLFFRTDAERSRTEVLPGNVDVSARGYQMSPLGPLFDTVGAAEVILTDRLHVAIAATLMGRRVSLFPNSYYKNRAVYEYSLRHFSNVQWCEWEEGVFE